MELAGTERPAYFNSNPWVHRWLWKQKDTRDGKFYWFVGTNTDTDVQNDVWIYRCQDSNGIRSIDPTATVHDPYSSTNPLWTENCLLNGIFQETTYQFMQGVGVETAVHSDRCTACSPGKYKSSTDANVLCSDCPAESTSVAQSTDITNCKCMEGYFLQGTTCAPCEAGTYKSSISNELCTHCPVTKTSPVRVLVCVIFIHL